MRTELAGNGLWSFYGNAAVARALSGTGCDWLCLDAQHGLFDRAATSQTLAGLGSADCHVTVRVPENNAAWIGFALDAGAHSVIVPLVETAEQALAAASACRYPPLGARSWGPAAWLHGETPLSADGANERARCAVMIETALSLDNLDAIASTPGIDMLFVGPYDLALALGTDVETLLAEEAVDAPLQRIVTAARRHDISLGAFAGSAERAKRLRALGFGAVAVATDVSALLDGAARTLSPGDAQPSAY